MFNYITAEKELAKKLVNYSCKIKEGEKVLITYSNCPNTLIESLIEEICKLKASPIIYRLDNEIKRRLLLNSSHETIKYYCDIVKPIMSSVDAVILISGSDNDFELSDIPHDKLDAFNKFYNEPIHFKLRCSKKWVLLRYPNSAFAQSSKLSSEKFKEYFFSVCTLDYLRLDNKMNNLKELMEKTDKVQIITPTTHITFSIKNMPVIKCSGECNIPDGEIYTAPIKESVNGYITFNVPIVENGIEYNNIKLTFENGKIIDFDCSNKESFERILNSDEGSRYLGEFAFGLNPYCKEYIKDILFDEKMTSSIHLAIGSSYEDCFNGNKSSVHLDLIQSHKLKDGGGEIYFDNVLIYKNGKFIVSNLVDLNSENLI